MKIHRIVLAAMLCMCAACGALAEEYRAIVTAGSMTVYADAGRTWPVGALPATTVVTVKEASDGTAKIAVNGGVGYAQASELTAIDALAQRATFNTDSRVYRSTNLSSAWLAVPKGMELNLLAVNGPWAMVENGGVVAYTNAAHLTVNEPEDDCDDDQGGTIVTETFTAEVTAESMRIYKGAAENTAQIGKLTKGTKVTVHAYSDRWAYIELDGAFGFAKIADMRRCEEKEDYINDPDRSVEEKIYLFLRRELELNDAAACGILANVEKECGFRVTAASYDGGYGICQWTGARNTRLKNWCAENGYDYTTLEGQLWYLKYELETHHPKTLRYMRGVENSPAGAYDAGHYFCYNFEIPANRATRSVERGNLAKDKYWLRYAA